MISVLNYDQNVKRNQFFSIHECLFKAKLNKKHITTIAKCSTSRYDTLQFHDVWFNFNEYRQIL